MARFGDGWLISERAGDSMSANSALFPAAHDVVCASEAGDNSWNRNMHERIQQWNLTPYNLLIRSPKPVWVYLKTHVNCSKIYHSLNYISDGARSSIFAHSSLGDNTRLKHRTHGCWLQGTWYAYEINPAFQLRIDAQNFVTYWSRNHNYCRYYALIMAFIHRRRNWTLIYMVIFLNELVKTPRRKL